MKHLGAIDYDESQRAFQFKIGYCECGKKILARKDELEEIVTTFGYLERRPGMRERILKRMARGMGVSLETT